MVPIVEPEVPDGDHSSNECYENFRSNQKCFEQLILCKVDLKGVILKPNMILPGNKSKEKFQMMRDSKLTLKCLKNSVPTEVPGIAFFI